MIKVYFDEWACRAHHFSQSGEVVHFTLSFNLRGIHYDILWEFPYEGKWEEDDEERHSDKVREAVRECLLEYSKNILVREELERREKELLEGLRKVKEERKNLIFFGGLR